MTREEKRGERKILTVLIGLVRQGKEGKRKDGPHPCPFIKGLYSMLKYCTHVPLLVFSLNQLNCEVNVLQAQRECFL